MKKLSVSILMLFVGIFLHGCITIQYVVTESPDGTDILSTQIDPTSQINTNEIDFFPSTTLTFSPTSTISPSPTSTTSPSPTSTITPSLTPESETTQVVNAIDNAACYTGPGLDYSIISYIKVDDHITLVGQNLDASWFFIQEQVYYKLCWIQKTKINLQQIRIEDLPKITAPPPPTSTPIPSIAPTRKPRPRRTGDGGYPPPTLPPYPVNWP